MADSPSGTEGDVSGDVSTELSRNLGLLEVTMIGIGAMIGAGVFALTGFAAGLAGPALLLAFLLNGIIAAFTAASYAELGAAFPEAGGAYSWVREALPSPYGFYTGWANWFAQAVTCALYAATFGSFFVTLVTEYSDIGLEFAVLGFLTPEKIITALVVVLFGYINYRGAEETGSIGVIVTSIKIVILAVFVIFGVIATLGHADWAANYTSVSEFAPNGVTGVLGAMGFVYVAFEGYDIIVQSGEEIKNPGRNIPRAIFYSLLVAVPIYLFVSFAAIGGIDVTPRLLEFAGMEGASTSIETWKLLGDLGELGIIRAAAQFVPFGFFLLIIAGLAATVSALNATLFASSRIAFSMSRDRLLPTELSELSEETRSPYLSIIASTTIVGIMAIALPIEIVASSSAVMFLLLFSMVNVAAIAMRRNRPDLERPFKIPYMPVIPILGIVFQLILAPFLLESQGLAIGFGEESKGFVALVTIVLWFALGVVVYLGYSSEREEEVLEEETPTVVAERATESRDSQLLVPIADPESAEQLMRAAVDVARERDAEIHVISVVTVAPQTPLAEGRQHVGERRELLSRAMAIGEEGGVPTQGTVRLGHDPATAIINTVEQYDSDTVLMGWHGQGRRRRDIVLGSNVDDVVRDARCDVLVERIGEPGDVESILVPTAGGPHAEYAAEVAGSIARANDAHVEIAYVVGSDADSDARTEAEELLAQAAESVGEHDSVSSQLLDGDDVVEEIVDRSGGHDLTIVGATRESLLQQLVFGAIPEEVARRADGTIIMAKRNLGITGWVRRYLGFGG